MKLRINKYAIMAIGLIVTVALFILGKGTEAHGITVANLAVASLTDAEKQGFNEQEQKVLLAVKKFTLQLKDDVEANRVKKDDIGAIISGIKMELGSDTAKTLKEQFEEVKNMAAKQGTTIQELQMKYNGVESGNKSISQVLEESKKDLEQVYLNGSGTKQFMISMNEKKQFVARPYNPTQKAAAVHAGVDGVGGGTSSVAQSIDAASLLRLGGDSPIVSQYRNNPWIFDLCNLVNAGTDMPLAMWYEEQAKQGASANVAEGGTKPLEQYAYTLKTATYRKEAVLLGFTDEFNLDFARLQSDILGKGRTDLVNRMNTAILARLISAATAYNTGPSFGSTASANEWDAIAAMAAQVDNATFGAAANAAITSTFKKYKMGVLKSTQGEYLNRPDVISSINLVGNPAMAANDVVVGDFKQYNILLRGGLIVKVGYNGTDFAENKFSVVMEQFYFDYISSIRAAAIVKGPDFPTVIAALA